MIKIPRGPDRVKTQKAPRKPAALGIAGGILSCAPPAQPL